MVIHDIPPYSIAVGTPAIFKKMRFIESIIRKLLEIKWWNYNITAIEEIDYSNIESVITELQSKINNNEIAVHKPIVYRDSQL